MLILPYLIDILYKSPSTGPGDSSALPDLIKVTVQAILEVLLLCLVGYVLGRKGIIDGKVKKSLNKVGSVVRWRIGFT